MERTEQTKELDLSCLLRAAAAWLFSAALLLPIAAAVITLADLKASSFRIFGLATGLFCAMAAGYAAKKKCGAPLWQVSGSSSLSLMILLLTTGFLVSDGKLGTEGILTVVGVTCAGCLLGALCAAKAKKLHRSHAVITKRRRSLFT